jgi:hypothetical protein
VADDKEQPAHPLHSEPTVMMVLPVSVEAHQT